MVHDGRWALLRRRAPRTAHRPPPMCTPCRCSATQSSHVPEVQHQPSLWPSSPLDEAVKTEVVDDLDELLAHQSAIQDAMRAACAGEDADAVRPPPSNPGG